MGDGGIGRDGPAAVSVTGYRIVRRIGSGGFATVYEAIQEDVEAPVALKVLNVDPTDSRLRERFERECRTMGRLRDQDGIVPVYQSTFTADGRPVIVMAYMPGGTLADRLHEHGTLSPDEVVRTGITLTDALAAAHRLGVFHRDIKPENILLDRNGRPALADLGIASVDGYLIGTRTEASLTPPHAPPERFLGEGDSDPVAGDVYSLASTLYQLLTGHPPFGTVAEGGIVSLATRVVDEPPPPIGRTDVPPALSDALFAALAKEPADRPDPAAFARLLAEDSPSPDRESRFEDETTESCPSSTPDSITVILPFSDAETVIRRTTADPMTPAPNEPASPVTGALEEHDQEHDPSHGLSSWLPVAVQAMLGVTSGLALIWVITLISGVLTPVGLLFMMTFVPNSVLVILWSYQSHQAAAQLASGDRRWSRRWAIGSWFVPLGNLVLPYLVIQETARIAFEPPIHPRNVPDQRQLTISAWLGATWWLSFIFMPVEFTALSTVYQMGLALPHGAEAISVLAFISAGVVSPALGALFIGSVSQRLPRSAAILGASTR